MTPSPSGGAAAGGRAAFVTVVVLNYNAAAYLHACLRALLATDYPLDAFEVLVVDNGSSDGSVESVEREFPSVRLLRAGRNLGFSAGNNLALEGAPGPYVALVNPDTEVQPGWLRPLVDRLESDPGLGAACPKLLLHQDRIPVTLDSATFVPRNQGMGADQRTLGVRLYSLSARAGAQLLAVDHRQGFGGIERDEAGRSFRWTLGLGELGIVAAGEGPIQISAEVSAPRPDGRPVRFEARAGGRVLLRAEAARSIGLFEFEIPVDCRELAAPVVQNAGSEPLAGGSSRDRGTKISWGNAYYDWDGEAYSVEGEVFAFTGAGVVLRKSMLERVGYFDETFFMYYEDTDLSLRARRRGWKLRYVPSSVIRHHHSALSVEWSPFFIRHVSRSRLYALIKNWPARVAIRALAAHAVETGRSGLHTIRLAATRDPGFGAERRRFRAMAGALTWLLPRLPRALALRAAERAAGPLDGGLISDWLAEP